MADEELNNEQTTEENPDDKYDITPPTADEVDKPDADDTPEAPETKADAPAETAAEETPTPETTETVDAGDEPQATFDPELVQRGEAVSLSRNAMRAMGPAEARATVLGLENAQLRASQKPAPDKPAAPGIDLDALDMDDGTRDILRAVISQNDKLSKTVEDLSQGVAQDKAVSQRREREATVNRFDTRLVKLNRPDHYGTGATLRDLDSTSPAYAARDELMATQQFYESRGHPEEAAFDRAVRAQHAKDAKQEAVDEIAKQVNKQAGQAISKPSSGGRAARQTGEQKALQTEIRMRKELGYPAIDEEVEDKRF